MARFEPSGRETKWMVASYAVPGGVLVLTLLVFAFAGYPFAARFLVMMAALAAGLGAWFVAARSSRRTPSVGLVAAVHLVVVIGLPALALTLFPGWIGAGKYDGLSFRTVPHAIWAGALLSLLQGMWPVVVGRSGRRAPDGRHGSS